MSFPSLFPRDLCGHEASPAEGSRDDRPVRFSRSRRCRALAGTDCGHSTAEYLGVILLIAAIVAALVVAGIGPMVARGIERAICLIANGPGVSCAADVNRASEVKCLTGRQKRQFGYNVTAFSVRADRSLNDRLSVYGGDAPSTVTLYEGSGVGAEGMVGLKQVVEASGRASLVGEVGYQYELDNEKQARDFLQARRGGLERYAKLGVPGASSAHTLVDFLRGSEERTPDKLVAKVGLKAQGNVGAESGAVEAGAQATLSGSGTVTHDVDTGERTFRVGMKGNGAAAGGLEGSQVPVELKGMLGGTASGSMQVKFGANGQPKTLIMTSKKGYSYGGEAGVNGDAIGVGDDLKDLSASKQRGRLDVKNARLDLTIPENRAAFEQLFQPVGGTMVVPKPQSPDAYVQNVRQLADRYASDGLFVDSTYGRDIAGGSGDVKSVGSVGGRGIKGGEGLTFGAGGHDDTTVLALRDARVMDRRDPSTGWQPLPTCNS